VFVFKTNGNAFERQAKLMSLDNYNDGFGWMAALTNGSIVAAAKWKDIYKGRALVFSSKEPPSFPEVQTIVAPNTNGTVSLMYGISIAILDNKMVIGAPHVGVPIFEADGRFNQTGLAFVYQLDRQSGEWILVKTLLALDGKTGEDSDWFGVSTAISSSYVAVGSSRNDNANGPGAGAVYLFHLDQFADSASSSKPILQ
jgi:hypothetical protein